MTQVILDVQECNIICSYTSSIVNGWLDGATGFVEVKRSLSCHIYRSSPVHTCLYFMEIFRMGTMRKRKLSLFEVVDHSLAKKANESLNGGNSMTPLINKWYEKLYSQRFWRRGRLLRYGIKKRSSQVDEYPIIINAISITCCHHQKLAAMAPSHGSLVK